MTYIFSQKSHIIKDIKKVDYFRFLKEQQVKRELKKEKRLKIQEEIKLKEVEEKRLNIVKILTFSTQLIIAAFLVLIVIYLIF